MWVVVAVFMLHSFPNGLGVHTATKKCHTEKCVKNILKYSMTSPNLVSIKVTDPDGKIKFWEFL